MPRAPKIIEETTGRLKRRTKAKFFKTKNLTLEQKKCIIEVCKNNKDLGMRKLSRLVGVELDLPVSKSTLHRILESQDEIKNVKTTPKTTRTKQISAIYHSFRDRLYDVCIAESHRTCIHNEDISLEQSCRYIYFL